MSAKSVFCAALLVTILGYGAARGQTPYPTMNPNYGTGQRQAPYTPNNPLDEPQTHPGQEDDPRMSQPTLERPGTLSSWITGPRSACCFGPVGGDGPIKEELFTRVGVSIPIGGGSIFSRTLQTGTDVGVGGRGLFFNAERTAAWTLELGLVSIWNHGTRPDIQIPLNLLVPSPAGQATPVSFGQGALPGLTIRSLNRTFANLGFGREYYLWGAAGCGSNTWRAGFDVGGRWGSSRAEFNEIRHRTGVVEGVWGAIHTDLEMPCGCCTFLAGFRAELSYTYSNILQEQNNAQVMDVNVLFNLGVRF